MAGTWFNHVKRINKLVSEEKGVLTLYGVYGGLLNAVEHFVTEVMLV